MVLPMDIMDSEPSNSFQPTLKGKEKERLSPDYKLKYSLAGHVKGVSSVKFSPDGEVLATAGADGVVHLWDTHTWDHLEALRGHEQGINDIAFSGNGLYLATASDDKTAQIWIVSSGTSIRTLSRHTSHLTCCSFNPKSNILATGSWDERCILWNVLTGAVLRELPAHSDPLTSVGFNVDGTMVVTGSFDGLMRLWDTSTGQCLKTIEDEQNSPISFASFTPNGDFLLSSSLSSAIRIWNYHTAKCLKTYRGHTNKKYACPALIIDPHVKGADRMKAWVVAGSEAIEDEAGELNGEVVVWDLQSREVLQRLRGHKDTVISVAAHPTKRIIASGSLERDKLVRIWIDEDDELTT